MANGAITEGMNVACARYYEDIRYILSLQTNFYFNLNANFTDINLYNGNANLIDI